MEIGEIPVSLPSLVKINDELNQLVIETTKNELREILADISEKYGIAKNDLYSRYMNRDVTINTETTISRNKRSRKNIAHEERCLAKISNGNQCSRRHKGDNSLYCGSHLTSRPFGEFKPMDSEPEETEKTKEKPVFKKIT